jgi:hypothetical protein
LPDPYRLRHIAGSDGNLFATTRFRLLTTQVQLGKCFTQGEDLLHQRPEAGEIEIVELIKLLYRALRRSIRSRRRSSSAFSSSLLAATCGSRHWVIARWLAARR